MHKVDPQSHRVLALLRDRPLSINELQPLLDEAPEDARQTVRQLMSDGLVSRLAGFLRSSISAPGGERRAEPQRMNH